MKLTLLLFAQQLECLALATSKVYEPLNYLIVVTLYKAFLVKQVYQFVK